MIDWTKPIRTKDGREVRVLCTDRVIDSDYKVLALVKNTNGYENVWAYTIEGKYRGLEHGDKSDLENVPEHTSFYLNVFKDGSSEEHYTLEDAMLDRTSRHTGTKFGGTLHLTFEGYNLLSAEIVEEM